MNALFFDIETIPSQAPDARELARASVKPPGTLRKAESIAAWHAEHGDEAAEELYKRQALSPSDGEVCAIGAAVDDGDVLVTVRTLEEGERAFLVRALKAVEEMLATRRPDPSDPVAPWLAGARAHPIGHNIGAFDAPFLRARLWANRIKMPAWLPGPLARVGKDYSDTMTTFCGPRDRISLDRLCRCLGVPNPKASGTTGADVLDLWLAGEHEALAAYCKADVEAVRSVWHVMTGVTLEGEAWAA